MSDTYDNRTTPSGSTSSEPPVVLEVIDLKTHFTVRSGFLQRSAPKVRAVDGVSFQVREGRTLGLVGESGCGKSTTGRTVVHLIEPTSGKVSVLGTDITNLGKQGRRQFRRDVQLVFQDPYSALDPRMTVHEIIAEPLRIHKIYEHEGGAARIAELLELVGLQPEHGERKPRAFSGGQRQRIGIARALALRPRLLILDEPVSALDVSIQAQVLNLLEDLQQELGLAFVLIAHDLAAVRHVSHEVGVMYLGRLAELGSRNDIFTSPGHPYTQALLSAVPDPDVVDDVNRHRTERIILKGEVPNPSNPPSGCRFRTRCWRAEQRCADEEPELEVREGFAQRIACHFPGDLGPPSSEGQQSR